MSCRVVYFASRYGLMDLQGSLQGTRQSAGGRGRGQNDSTGTELRRSESLMA